MVCFSFIFLCYNHWQYTKEAVETLLASLEASIYYKGIELILIDNGSTDETPLGIEKLKTKYTSPYLRIKAVHVKENMGYPIGVNIGLSHCSGRYVAIMNNDLIFIKGWFSAIIQLLEHNPAIGVAVPHLSYGSGVQHVGVYLEDRDTIQAYGQRYMLKNHGKNTYLDRGIGACMVMKKAVIDKVGGNDIWYGIGHYDDDDWSLRIRIAGFKIVAVGGSFVYHQGSKTFQAYYPEQSHYVKMNQRKFYQKWGLKKDRIRDDMYVDRQWLIEKTRYQKADHYIPIKYIADKPSESYQRRGILWVADWTYKHSGWTQSLDHIHPMTNDKDKLYVWIPSRYYEDDVKQYVYDRILLHRHKKNMEHVIFLHQNMKSLTLLNFIKRFSYVIPIERDFINQYILYLFKNR